MKLDNQSIAAPAVFAGLPLLAALAVSGLSLDAQAASDCPVTSTVDDGDPGSLRYCVDQLNQGLYSNIVFNTSGPVLLEYPLLLEKTQNWVGNGVTVSPDANFGAPSLVEVEDQVEWSASQLNLVSDGSTKQRAVHLLGGDSIATLDDVTIDGFQTADNGGGILLDDGRLDADELIVSNCVADSGGGIAVENGKVTLLNSRVADNVATKNGGGIFGANDPSVTLSLEVTEVHRNSALFGGGVSCDGTSTTMTDVSFEANDAQSGGGLLGTATILRGSFESNTALGNPQGDAEGGGAIQSSGAMRISQSYFSGNMAKDGGAIKVESNDFVLERSALFANFTDGHRGASALSVLADGAIVRNTTFAYNHATHPNEAGTAVIVLGDAAEFEHVTIADNTSTSNLKGLWVPAGGELTVRSTMFANVQQPGSIDRECVIAGQFHEETSMARGVGCGNSITQAAAWPVHPCGGPGDQTDGCEPILGIGMSSCHSTIDQRGATRPSSGCSIGALEAG